LEEARRFYLLFEVLEVFGGEKVELCKDDGKIEKIQKQKGNLYACIFSKRVK